MNTKNLLLGLLAVGALGLTSCEKDEIEALNRDIEQLELQSAAGDSNLQNQIDALRAELNMRLEDLQSLLEASIAASNQEQSDALAAAQAALNAAIALNASADAASDEAQASALASAVELLNAAIAANGEESDAALAAAQASLQAAIDANSDADAAQAAADASALMMASASLNDALVLERVLRIQGDDGLADDLAEAITNLNAAIARGDQQTISGLLVILTNRIASVNDRIDAIQLAIDAINTELDGLTAVSASISGDILTLNVGEVAYTIDTSGGSNGQNGAAGRSISGISLGSLDADGCRDITVSFSDNTNTVLENAVCNGADGAAGSGGNGVALNWGPDFVAQTANFMQTANLEGAELSREVIVVAGQAVETLGASSESTTYNGLGSLADAQAALAGNVGTHQIVVVVTTTIADGTSVITYSATADNGNVDLGSHDVSSVLSGSSSSSSSTTEYIVAADPVDTLSAWSAWIGDAPSATTEYGPYGAWDEQFAPSAVIESGTPVVTVETAGSTVASVTETTTTPQFSVVAAYPRARTRTATSVVAAYDQTRTRTIIVNGDEDATPPAGELSQTRTIAEVRTALADDPQGETVAEVRTPIADLVTTREIANPAYVAPSSGGGENGLEFEEMPGEELSGGGSSGTPGDLDGDGSVTYADAVMAGFSVDTVAGALGGYRFTYSAATGLADELASTSTIGRELRTFDTITVALATQYAEAKVLAAYIAQL